MYCFQYKDNNNNNRLESILAIQLYTVTNIEKDGGTGDRREDEIYGMHTPKSGVG